MVISWNKPKAIAFYTLYEIIARNRAEAVLMSFAQAKNGCQGMWWYLQLLPLLFFSLWSSPRKRSGMGGRMLSMPYLGAMWKVSDGKLVGSKKSLWTKYVSQQRCWVSLKMSGQNMQAKVHIQRRENVGQ